MRHFLFGLSYQRKLGDFFFHKLLLFCQFLHITAGLKFKPKILSTHSAFKKSYNQWGKKNYIKEIVKSGGHYGLSLCFRWDVLLFKNTAL
jgi:hypothetical protein